MFIRLIIVGIGLAVTRRLLADQTIRVIVMSRSRPSLDRIQKEAPDRIEVVSGNAGDLSLGEKAVDVAVKRWERLDGIIINHGQVEPVQRIADADLNAWKEAFDVNFLSAVSMVKAAIPELRKSQGRIILTSSGAAVKGTSTWGCYGASKAALNHLALTLQKEEPDITTIAIRPGVVDTQMQDTLASQHFNTMEEEDAQRFKTMRAEGKMLKPEQPGNVIARLVLEARKKLSGLFLKYVNCAVLPAVGV